MVGLKARCVVEGVVKRKYIWGGERKARLDQTRRVEALLTRYRGGVRRGRGKVRVMMIDYDDNNNNCYSRWAWMIIYSN